MGIEKGFKFRPTDEEIMRCLLNRVTGSRSLAWSCDDDDVIGTADLYGTKEPWEVFGGDRKEKERLFFTELRRVGKNKTRNQRICRNVGKGFWSNKGQKIWIYGQKGIIGYKRGFRYERKKGVNSSSAAADLDFDWLLKEYLVTVRRGVKEKYANCALCILKRRKKKKNGEYSGGSPTEDEISAAAEIEVTDEWLRQELGDDHLIDEDDAPRGDDHLIHDDDAPRDDGRASVPIEEDCTSSMQQQEVDGWILDDQRVIDDDDAPGDDGRASVPIEEECSRMQQEVDEWDDHRVIEEEECSAAVPIDEWLDGDLEEECSILAAAAARAPPIDLISSSLEEGQKGDFDFAAWDVFGDSQFPWAGTQQMLPVV